MIDWTKYKSLPPTIKPNKLKIPVNNFGFEENQINEFNELYDWCIEQEQLGNLKEFELTKSKGISIKASSNRGARWLLTIKTTFCELFLKHPDTCCYYRWIIGYKKDEIKGLTGRRCFQIYCKMLEKFGVNLEELAIENGEEVKKTIPAPKIECKVAFKRSFSECHHIDLNSAYNAGMMKAFPVLEPAIRHMYSLRKTNEDYKNVLAITQGFMQSELVNYRYAHISKAGYEYTNKRLDELTKQLESTGRRILSYNTDGIWYQGEIYHDEDEGTDIGQWKHDYTNATIRFKSHGCYEFEWNDDAGYHYKPVVRGNTTYEKIVPRDEWKWGDIFKGSEIGYYFKEGVGIVNVTNREEF